MRDIISQLRALSIKALQFLGKGKSLSRVRLFATRWTVAYQASQSMGFSRQEYQSGLLFPFIGALSNPTIKLKSPVSPELQADALPSKPPGKHVFK